MESPPLVLKRLDPERSVWGAWTGVHGRSLRPEVLAAIEAVLAGKARRLPRALCPTESVGSALLCTSAARGAAKVMSKSI